MTSCLQLEMHVVDTCAGCNSVRCFLFAYNARGFHQIAEYGEEGFCSIIDSETKNGEAFRAFSIIPSKVNYSPKTIKDPSLNTPAAIS